MEFILTDANAVDTRFIPFGSKIDINIGTDNDISLSVPLNDYQGCIAGGYVYCNGTEFGGKIHNPVVNTSEEKMTFDGITFRGILDTRYVLVPSGNDYRYVSGNIDTVMQTLLTEHFDSLFTYVPCGLNITITNYKLPRYYSLLECMERILSSIGRKLVIEADGSLYNLSVSVKTAEIRDLTDSVEYSQDNGFEFRIKKISRHYEYVLALGSGSLQERIVKMYKFNLSTRKLSDVTSFPKNVEVVKFDYPNAESVEDLAEQTLAKMRELNESDSQSMTVSEDLELYLGDIVAGRDYTTGTYITSKVSDVILKQSDDDFSISYKVGE